MGHDPEKFQLNEKQQKMVEENIKLTYHTIKKYYPNLWKNEDIEQVAAIGLCKAAHKFDENRGVAFSTFAVPVIRAYIWANIRARTYSEKIEQKRVSKPRFFFC